MNEAADYNPDLAVQSSPPFPNLRGPHLSPALTNPCMFPRMPGIFLTFSCDVQPLRFSGGFGQRRGETRRDKRGGRWHQSVSRSEIMEQIDSGGGNQRGAKCQRCDEFKHLWSCFHSCIYSKYSLICLICPYMSNRTRLRDVNGVKFNPWTKHKKKSRVGAVGWEVAGSGCGASNPSQRPQQSLGWRQVCCQRACQWRQTRTRGILEGAEHQLSLLSLFTAVFHSLRCRPKPCR